MKRLFDFEQESVLVTVPHLTRPIGSESIEMTVDLLDDEIMAVHFADPARWRSKLFRLGYPTNELWVEGFLEGLARVAYARRNRGW